MPELRTRLSDRAAPRGARRSRLPPSEPDGQHDFGPVARAMDSKRWPTWIVLVALALFLFAGWPFLSGTAAEEIPYSEFKQSLARGEVTEVRIGERGLSGTLARAPEVGEEGGDAESEAIRFRTVSVDDPGLVAQLEAAGVEYTGAVEDSLTHVLLSWLLPMALLTVLFVLLLRTTGRSAGAQAIGFGRSKAKLVPEKGTGVTFEDVAGCDEAKAELREMVAFLKDPKRFTALGARIPKGVLLLGPPGTGKTLLARAMAGEAGVPFFSINGSDFVEMFVGVGAARVRDLFDQAKAKAPCIVFVDEVDAVGRQRGVSMGVVNDEREQTLNQLLSEMDGFEANSGVILLAATNRPEILDRALLRAGRFDRQVVLDSPDRTGREAILRVHARGKALAPDVDLSRIAQSTPGMSGADLANALNEAALAAAQAGGKEIHQVDVEQAIERVVAGPERRSRRLGADEKRRVAYHESGHAIVAAHCEHADPIRKISIVPRGRAALGYTLMLPEEDQLLRTREQLQDRLTVLLGGRAAEILRLGGPSTGAQDDLETATALARQMVTMFGMSERVGLPCWARPADGRFLPVEGALQRDCSEATAREIDEEVRRLLDEAYERARDLLVGHVEELERVARELLERETLDRGRFDELLADSACVPETDHRNASVSA